MWTTASNAERYGCSMTPQLRTFLWFETGLDEALKFYKDAFGHVVVHGENRMDDGSLFTADFSIFGHSFIGMCWPGGPTFNASISLSITCDGQEEVDRLWEAITRDGTAGQCGWCTDKFGVTWQVSPRQMRDHLENPDPDKAAYAMAALRTMSKIVLRDLYE